MKIIKKAYHRNGVGGNGFDVVIFKEGKRKMLAINFYEDGYCAVFDKDKLDKDVIEFGENSFSCDDFQKELREKVENELAK